MHCTFKKYRLHFKEPGGTSRGILRYKDTYFLILQDGEKLAFGECNLFKGLSADDRPDYEGKLTEVCNRIFEEKEKILSSLTKWPSIAFGVETLLKDWNNGCNRIIFPEAFKENSFSVPVNGLIWMGTEQEMKKRIDEKLKAGNPCIKLKIGAIDFEKELKLVRYIRERKTKDEVEIRLDANGAFSPQEAMRKTEILFPFNIHYIEQPIRAGQLQEMASLIEKSPIPIALDEELIGVYSKEERIKLLNTLNPRILILKPALIGGFAACDYYRLYLKGIDKEFTITSALETNIGLNAIAQYIATTHPQSAQGIGTGHLFTNNILSPYELEHGNLIYHPEKKWDLKPLL